MKNKTAKKFFMIITAIIMVVTSIVSMTSCGEREEYSYKDISFNATLNGEDATEDARSEVESTLLMLEYYYKNVKLIITKDRITFANSDNKTVASYKYTNKNGKLVLDDEDIVKLAVDIGMSTTNEMFDEYNIDMYFLQNDDSATYIIEMNYVYFGQRFEIKMQINYLK